MIAPETVADRLLSARRQGVPIDPFTDTHDLDLDTAYKAQSCFVRELEQAGDPLVGAKLGLTSRAKQEAMGVCEPLYGRLTASMVLEGGAPVPMDALIQPRAEPEIAFLLGRDLIGPTTVAGVLAAADAVFCGLDILDSRFCDYRFRLPDVVADNCSSGRVVLGPRARRPADLEDLRLVGCVFRAHGDLMATAAGAAVMGHPAASVAWLVNRLAERGEALPAGSLILSGALTAPVPVEPGTCVTAEFDGLGVVELWTEAVEVEVTGDHKKGQP